MILEAKNITNDGGDRHKMEIINELSLYEQISGELEKTEEKLKIKRQDIEASERLLKLFSAIGISKFVELAYLYSVNELNFILDSIEKDAGVTDKDLLAKAVSLWPRIFRDDDKNVKWALSGDLMGKLAEGITANQVLNILKKIIRSLDNKIYLYKKYGFTQVQNETIHYSVYDRKQQVWLTISLKEEDGEGVTEIKIEEIVKVMPGNGEGKSFNNKPVITEDAIERSVLFGTIVQIKSEGRVAYKAAIPKVWWHKMPKSLELGAWKQYLASLKISQKLADSYLKIAEYVVKNKEYLKGYSFERLFFKSFVLLHHDNENIKDSAFFLLRKARAALNYNSACKINYKLKEIAGEISGIYEVSVKRGTVLGYLCAAPIKAIRLPIKCQWFKQEGDAISKNAVFEFKYAVALKDIYSQIFGIGRAHSYLESLVY